MSEVIVTRRLVKRYGGRAVLDRLDLRVPRGAIYALLGDNGAGKTTTMKLLTGQVPPDGGSAELLGEDCWSAALALRHRVGYVPERPRFYDWMTVGETGRFAAAFHRPGYLGRFLDWADRLDLDLSKRLRDLSKGGYARVGLALALALDPEVLLLDEPTSGLDLLTRREFLSGMVELAGEGKTVLICTHQIAEVERVASHVGFLAQGKLVLTATAEELKRGFRRLRLRYEGAPPDPNSVGTVLQRNGSGRQWEVVARDCDPAAVAALRDSPNVTDFEEAPLSLEEIYTVLMARAARPRQGRPEWDEEDVPHAAGAEEERL